ncbi:uncharacterized protein LOC134802398 isoform X2 [Cydia splendana]|uniref:uncharacterized protein LOC134802398 isoform X2 n=1 Tax=Cydia splendana TaxID=1100963 RepID=UPI00300D0214
MLYHWYLLVPILTIEAGHMAYNTSDVITTYTGHSDVQAPVEFRKGNEKGRKSGGERKGDKLKSEREEEKEANDSDYLEQTTAATEAGNDVVFIPSGNSDAQSFRRAEGARRDEYSVKDMMERVAVGDVINERYKTETEPPEGGVVFKPGKNDERTEEKIKHEMDDERIEQAVKEYKEVYENPMDCENLDCENVLEAVCGVKLENKRPKYRLFKNECFFRKVNCGLRYDYNRYRTVSIDQCDGVGSHLPPQEHAGWLQYQPRPLPRSQPSGGGGGQSSGRRSASRRDYDEIKNIPTRKYNQRKLERWPNGFKHDLIASQAQYKSKMMQYLSRALGSRTG